MHEVELRAKAHSMSDYRLNGAAFTAVFIPDHHVTTRSISHPVVIAEDVTSKKTATARLVWICIWAFVCGRACVHDVHVVCACMWCGVGGRVGGWMGMGMCRGSSRVLGG
jgi:hypothetical protein